MSERRKTITVPAKEVEVVIGWSCDKCAAPIEPEGGYSDQWGAVNPRDALPVYFGGYYGGYFDCARQGPKWTLCKACADELLAAFPFFKTALEKFLNAEFGIFESNPPE